MFFNKKIDKNDLLNVINELSLDDSMKLMQIIVSRQLQAKMSSDIPYHSMVIEDEKIHHDYNPAFIMYLHSLGYEGDNTTILKKWENNMMEKYVKQIVDKKVESLQESEEPYLNSSLEGTDEHGNLKYLIDYNAAFIKYALSMGITGTTEEEIVNKFIFHKKEMINE